MSLKIVLHLKNFTPLEKTTAEIIQKDFIIIKKGEKSCQE